jgi:hypothetical protein
MKTFKYDFTYKAKSYKGTVESPLDLATYGGENERTLMRLLANKYGLDSDFTNSSRSKYNIMVFRVEEQRNSTSSVPTPKREIPQEERDANRAAAIETDRERRAERAEERERKAIRDERQRLIDIEEAKVRAEKEAREKAERKQRADELRSQGKNFQAFLVEFQNGVIAGSLVVGIGLFLLISSYNKKSNMGDAMKINSELELIEDSVKIYIINKNYDKALLLANKLVHSSHENMEHLEFDTWNGYPKFDEYWTKKREVYKKIIFNKGSLNTEQPTVDNKKIEETESEEVDQTPIEEDKFIYSESDTINNQDGLDDEYKY